MVTNFRYDDTTFSVTNVTVRDYDNAVDINKGLMCLLECANLFFNARHNKAIEFKAGVTESMLEMMSILLSRAAHTSGEQRSAMFQRWEEQGPQQSNALIKEVEEREVKILAPDDFAMFLKCPRGVLRFLCPTMVKTQLQVMWMLSMDGWALGRRAGKGVFLHPLNNCPNIRHG